MLYADDTVLRVKIKKEDPNSLQSTGVNFWTDLVHREHLFM